MDVTVVIPTYRRPGGLRRVLAGLREQQAGFDWEVVVVDNDAAGSARPVADELGGTVPLRYVVEPVTGAAHARNRGIEAAQGRVVAMLDDDVVPQAGWLAAVAAPVLDGSAAGAGGRVVLDPAVPRPGWFDEAGIGGYLTAFSLGEQPRPLHGDEIVVTANAAFDRAMLQRVGGFDPAYGPRGRTQLVADDAHLVRQVRRAGGEVVYRPEAVVVHDLPAQRLTRGYLIRRAYWQGRSDWLLWRTDHASRRFGGARVAAVLSTGWFRRELRQRRAEGLARPAVAFHTACDVARLAGTLRQAATGIVTSGVEQR